jgi:N-acetylglucosamine-6-phosphate deacetylase
METKLLIEQHFHGAYGVDFNTASVDDILFLSRKIIDDGVGYIFPTLVTDSIENIKRQIEIIKKAAICQTKDMARICGVHLEGIFLNPEKKGIHNSAYFLKPTIDNFKLIENDFIKIVTLAPEFVESELLEYLHLKGIKVQAGHCVGSNLKGCDGVTHTFNAMAGITHRASSTALSALIDDDIYTEIIADGVHVKDDALKLLFKVKQMNKILLISDCLPCTHSDIKEFEFAGSKIYYDGVKATSKDGTLAGSTKLLPDIVKILGQKGLFSKQYISNSYDYHNLESFGVVEWDNDFNVVKVKY